MEYLFDKVDAIIEEAIAQGIFSEDMLSLNYFGLHVYDFSQGINHYFKNEFTGKFVCVQVNPLLLGLFMN